MRRTLATAICASVLCLSAAHAGRTAAAQGYEHFVVGNIDDVTRPTSGLTVLHGGGSDLDEIFVRMGAAAGGGDFVVIRASGTDAYNPYIYELCGCDSVETIIFKNRQAAFDPFVIGRIRNAEAVWIAGGDQSDYVTFWKDTPVEAEINALAARPAPIGGLSAGTAIMGEFVYSAMSASSLTSSEGLANPFHRDLTLARDFLRLPSLDGLITDQHLEERDRMGRTVAFLARLVQDGWTADGRAVASDRETALLLNPSTGTAEVISTKNHRYTLRLLPANVGSSGGLPAKDSADLSQRGRVSDRPRWNLRSGRVARLGRHRLHAVGGGGCADVFERRDLLIRFGAIGHGNDRQRSLESAARSSRCAQAGAGARATNLIAPSCDRTWVRLRVAAVHLLKNAGPCRTREALTIRPRSF